MDFHKRYTFVQVNASGKFFETHEARIKALDDMLEELQKALEEAYAQCFQAPFVKLVGALVSAVQANTELPDDINIMLDAVISTIVAPNDLHLPKILHEVLLQGMLRSSQAFTETVDAIKSVVPPIAVVQMMGLAVDIINDTKAISFVETVLRHSPALERVGGRAGPPDERVELFARCCQEVLGGAG
jgi:hypothetical protein